MGFYWTTYFYPDHKNESTRILLAYMDPIIDSNDDLNGFVSKTQLLQYYPSLVQESDITDASRVVEFISSTYGDVDKTKELPVK